MKPTNESRRTRQDYSGLSITALAFGTMLSVAILAFGCGENIGGNGAPAKADSPSITRPTQTQQVASANSPATVVLPASVETVRTPATPEPVSFADAEAAYHERRYQDASRMFANYVATHAENAWGHYMLGLSSWKSGNREAAEVAFGKALELDRGHIKSWVNLGRVLVELERPDEALVSIDEALARKPESNDALRTKGRALEDLGRPDEAIAAYTDALLVDDEDAWSMNNLGLVYIRSDRFEMALPPLARAVELRDDVAVFYNNLGIALERSGRGEQAAVAYASAVAIDSSYAKASANLARVEAVKTDSALEPVDLGQLAVEFADEILRQMAERAVEPVTPVDQTTEDAASDALPEASEVKSESSVEPAAEVEPETEVELKAEVEPEVGEKDRVSIGKADNSGTNKDRVQE